MALCGARNRNGSRCRQHATARGRCRQHGGIYKPHWNRWQVGIAAARARNAILRELGRWPGGRPIGWKKLQVGIDRRGLVIAMAKELLEITDAMPLQGGGEVDLMLTVWQKAMRHCVTMLDSPDYRPMEDLKRDRLVYEMCQGIGNQLVRIGEGLLQREKHDRIAELLEKLKAPEQGEKKRTRSKKTS